MGAKAVECLMRGCSNIMGGIKNNRMVATSLEDAIKQHPTLNPEFLKVAQIASI
jgi:6-phosphofructokinase